MVLVRKVLRKVPDPRGRKGRQHPLEALLGLILLSMLTPCVREVVRCSDFL